MLIRRQPSFFNFHFTAQTQIIENCANEKSRIEDLHVVEDIHNSQTFCRVEFGPLCDMTYYIPGPGEGMLVAK